MRSEMARLFVALLLFVTAATGIALVRHADEMPAVTDPGRAAVLLAWQRTDDMKDIDKISREWHEEMESIKTSKWKYHDFGRGLIVLSITISVLIFYLYRVRRETLRSLTSPKRPSTFILVGNAILAATQYGVIQLYSEDQDRGTFPSWSETVFIPIMLSFMFLFALALVLSLIGYFVIRRRQIPVSLWVWDGAAPIKMWLLALGCALLAAPVLRQLFSDVQYGTYFGPLAAFAALYLLLSTRAALSVPGNQKRVALQ